ncbi:hypothetical protein BKA66DRAFT_444207 [Pyrenochaeta sp. MPI-SDFR-AT-0127]|nr:hypothetical protein BKA66DRAFT_444207 [Pyrenochaeta sp. MPI-SDFR-AT-0127]
MCLVHCDKNPSFFRLSTMRGRPLHHGRGWSHPPRFVMAMCSRQRADTGPIHTNMMLTRCPHPPVRPPRWGGGVRVRNVAHPSLQVARPYQGPVFLPLLPKRNRAPSDSTLQLRFPSRQSLTSSSSRSLVENEHPASDPPRHTPDARGGERTLGHF